MFTNHVSEAFEMPCLPERKEKYGIEYQNRGTLNPAPNSVSRHSVCSQTDYRAKRIKQQVHPSGPAPFPKDDEGYKNYEAQRWDDMRERKKGMLGERKIKPGCRPR